jgi:hypothetical protein
MMSVIFLPPFLTLFRCLRYFFFFRSFYTTNIVKETIEVGKNKKYSDNESHGIAIIFSSFLSPRELFIAVYFFLSSPLVLLMRVWVLH